PRPLHPPPTLSSWSTRPAGTCRHAWSYRPTSPSSRCHPNVPSSTRLRTCGSSCATTGFRTGSSNHTTISSTIVARPGTRSSISRGTSCLSDCVNGRTSSDQWDSVLVLKTSRPRDIGTITEVNRVTIGNWIRCYLPTLLPYTICLAHLMNLTLSYSPRMTCL